MKHTATICLLVAAILVPGCDSSTANSTNVPKDDNVLADLPSPSITVSRSRTSIFDTVKISILSSVVGGYTRYTLDGTEPNTASPKYDSELSLISAPAKIMAKTWFGTSISNTVSKSISYDASWNSSISYGSVTDSRDGKIYKTVKIGNQTWFAENLNYRTSKSSVIFRNSQWDSIAIGDWCYNNDDNMCSIYGRLYSWPRAMNIPDSCGMEVNNCSNLVKKPNQGACPTGWHVPDSLEWNQLLTFVGVKNGILDSVAVLKLAATGSWSNKGTDDFGFRILPGGATSSYVEFDFIHYSALFVSATTTYRSMYGLIGSLQYNKTFVYLARAAQAKAGTALFNAMSLRCIKD